MGHDIPILSENLRVPFNRRAWQAAKATREAGDAVTMVCATGKGGASQPAPTEIVDQ